MKKLIASFLLASILISTLLTGCANVEQSGDDTSGATTAVSNNGNPAQSMDAPNETTEYVPTTEELLGFGKESNGNRKFTLLATTAKDYDFNVESERGDIVDDAVFKKDSLTEDYLGIDIEIVWEHGAWANRSKFNSLITNAYETGDNTYDLVNNAVVCTLQLAQKGVLLNVNELQYTNLDQPWYVADMVEDFGIKGKLYGIMGDHSLSLYKDLSVIFFNVDLWQETRSEVDLYQMVRNNEWTLDTFLELTSGMAKDLNGDGQYDAENDRLAFFGEAVPNRTWLTAMDMHIIDMNSDGTYTYHGLTQRLADMYDRLVEYRATVPGVLDQDSASTKNVGKITTRDAFAAGRVATMCHKIVSTEFIRDMSDDYGIVPIPKYDKTQEKYLSQVATAISTFFIPQNQDDYDLISKFIECESYFGYTHVSPVYYESALKARYVNDPNIFEMLDMIRENATASFLFVYSSNLSSQPTAIWGFDLAPKADLASHFKTIERIFVESLEKMIKTYDSLE